MYKSIYLQLQKLYIVLLRITVLYLCKIKSITVLAFWKNNDAIELNNTQSKVYHNYNKLNKEYDDDNNVLIIFRSNLSPGAKSNVLFVYMRMTKWQGRDSG